MGDFGIPPNPEDRSAAHYYYSHIIEFLFVALEKRVLGSGHNSMDNGRSAPLPPKNSIVPI